MGPGALKIYRLGNVGRKVCPVSKRMRIWTTAVSLLFDTSADKYPAWELFPFNSKRQQPWRRGSPFPQNALAWCTCCYSQTPFNLPSNSHSFGHRALFPSYFSWSTCGNNHNAVLKRQPPKPQEVSSPLSNAGRNLLEGFLPTRPHNHPSMTSDWSSQSPTQSNL